MANDKASTFDFVQNISAQFGDNIGTSFDYYLGFHPFSFQANWARQLGQYQAQRIVEQFRSTFGHILPVVVRGRSFIT